MRKRPALVFDSDSDSASDDDSEFSGPSSPPATRARTAPMTRRATAETIVVSSSEEEADLALTESSGNASLDFDTESESESEPEPAPVAHPMPRRPVRATRAVPRVAPSDDTGDDNATRTPPPRIYHKVPHPSGPWLVSEVEFNPSKLPECIRANECVCCFERAYTGIVHRACGTVICMQCYHNMLLVCPDQREAACPMCRGRCGMPDIILLRPLAPSADGQCVRALCANPNANVNPVSGICNTCTELDLDNSATPAEASAKRLYRRKALYERLRISPAIQRVLATDISCSIVAVLASHISPSTALRNFQDTLIHLVQETRRGILAADFVILARQFHALAPPVIGAAREDFMRDVAHVLAPAVLDKENLRKEVQDAPELGIGMMRALDVDIDAIPTVPTALWTERYGRKPPPAIVMDAHGKPSKHGGDTQNTYCAAQQVERVSAVLNQ